MLSFAAKNRQAFTTQMGEKTTPQNMRKPTSTPPNTYSNKSPVYREMSNAGDSSKYGSMPANTTYYDLPVKKDGANNSSTCSPPPVGSAYYPHRYRSTTPFAAPMASDVLKREENFKLPDRIVYETFI